MKLLFYYYFPLYERSTTLATSNDLSHWEGRWDMTVYLSECCQFAHRKKEVLNQVWLLDGLKFAGKSKLPLGTSVSTSLAGYRKLIIHLCLWYKFPVQSLKAFCDEGLIQPYNEQDLLFYIWGNWGTGRQRIGMYGASVAAKGGTRILLLLGSTALPAGRDKVPHSLWKSHRSYLHEMFLRGSRGPPVFDVWLETAQRDLLFASEHCALWHLETKLPLASVASENFGLIILRVAAFRTEIYVYFGKRGLLTPLAN